MISETCSQRTRTQPNHSYSGRYQKKLAKYLKKIQHVFGLLGKKIKRNNKYKNEIMEMCRTAVGTRAPGISHSSNSFFSLNI